MSNGQENHDINRVNKSHQTLVAFACDNITSECINIIKTASKKRNYKEIDECITLIEEIQKKQKVIILKVVPLYSVRP